jgi:hypothetical protein
LPIAPQPQRKKLIELNQQRAVYFMNLDIEWPFLSRVAVRVVQARRLGYDLNSMWNSTSVLYKKYPKGRD